MWTVWAGQRVEIRKEKVMDGVLAATFVYPLCVDKAVEIGNRILHDSTSIRRSSTTSRLRW